VTTPRTPPEYTTVQTARAVYLLARGAIAAMVGRDPAGTKWDSKLGDLAAKASGHDGPAS
jgi:hypothetical protein